MSAASCSVANQLNTFAACNIVDFTSFDLEGALLQFVCLMRSLIRVNGFVAERNRGPAENERVAKSNIGDHKTAMLILPRRERRLRMRLIRLFAMRMARGIQTHYFHLRTLFRRALRRGHQQAGSCVYFQDGCSGFGPGQIGRPSQALRRSAKGWASCTTFLWLLSRYK